MLVKTGLAVSQMSGTMGGVVASHNRYGQYFRIWRKPTDPNSERQMLRRAAMAQAVAAWRALGQSDMDTWNAYAAATPWTNRLGEAVYLSGMQHYIRVYTYGSMIASEASTEYEAPEACGSAGGLPAGIASAVPTVGVTAGLSLAYKNDDSWCTDVGALCVIRMSRPRPGSQVYGKGPYRLCAFITGAAQAPASPKVVAAHDLPYPLVAGQRVDFSIRIMRTDYTLSGEVVVSAEVGA